MQRCGRLGSHRNINGTLYGPDSSCCKTFVVAPVAKSLDFSVCCSLSKLGLLAF